LFLIKLVTHVLLKVQLIGYPVSKNELFMVCEFSEKVHNPQHKGVLGLRICFFVSDYWCYFFYDKEGRAFFHMIPKAFTIIWCKLLTRFVCTGPWCSQKPIKPFWCIKRLLMCKTIKLSSPWWPSVQSNRSTFLEFHWLDHIKTTKFSFLNIQAIGKGTGSRENHSLNF
jgi:hypothetical protein